MKKLLICITKKQLNGIIKHFEILEKIQECAKYYDTPNQPRFIFDEQWFLDKIDKINKYSVKW